VIEKRIGSSVAGDDGAVGPRPVSGSHSLIVYWSRFDGRIILEWYNPATIFAASPKYKQSY
jgi:hypothetical protein